MLFVERIEIFSSRWRQCKKTGSFKFRGACNATLALVERKEEENCLTSSTGTDIDRSKDNGTIHVVTHSSGNHAAAVALAAAQVSELSCSNKTSNIKNIRSTIVMPRNAPRIKVNGVKGFGGTIVSVDNTNEAREEMADVIVERDGATFIHPSENEYVIAGQGTVSLEMVKQVREIIIKKEREGSVSSDLENIDSKSHQDLDAVIIPVGGGGLAAGNTIALRGLLGDKVKIILAEPAEMDDAKRSKESGQLLGHDPDNKLNSCADGLKTTLGPNTWPIVRDLVDNIFTVSEVEILRATKLIWERLKITIEPSAGVGIAVALGDEFRKMYPAESGIQNIGIILCGGNVDVIKICQLMQEYGIE